MTRVSLLIVFALSLSVPLPARAENQTRLGTSPNICELSIGELAEIDLALAQGVASHYLSRYRRAVENGRRLVAELDNLEKIAHSSLHTFILDDKRQAAATLQDLEVGLLKLEQQTKAAGLRADIQPTQGSELAATLALSPCSAVSPLR